MRVLNLLAVSTTLALSMGPLSTTSLAANSGPDRPALRQHVAHGDDIAAAISRNLHQASPATPNSGSVCKAERSKTGNVQVNCQAEDGSSIFSQQNETTISAFGSKVVVGFNDDLVCCSAINFSGYSVSTNGGRTFTDRGNVPWSPDVQPIGDPSLSHDDEGNFFYASLALDLSVPTADSLIVVYEMTAGSNSFRRLSVPVNVGDSSTNFADKELLEVGQDGDGNRHFYITWTSYMNNSVNQGAVMLTDSKDGVHWRTIQVSPGIPCQPLSPAAHPLLAGNTVYVSYIEMNIATCTTAPQATNGHHTMVTVDVPSGRVTAVKQIASVQGAGDIVQFCGQGWLQVIQTEPGHNIRSPELPSSAVDENGTLYDVWSDRPAGPGGGNGNATRIYLSYSLDGNASWSPPQVISGAAAPNFMNDRFQPWIVTDGDGLHAIWYERVKAPDGGPDWLRTDKADLSLATKKRAPRASNGGETVLSSVPFPVIDTGGGCYMGDYNQIASNGHRLFVSWGDNRNTVTTPAGPVNEPDVFSQSYGAEND
jgi:hypothetical protein